MARYFARGNTRIIELVPVIRWSSIGLDICIRGKGTPRLANLLACVNTEVHLKSVFLQQTYKNEIFPDLRVPQGDCD